MNDITLVRWPEEAHRRDQLAASSAPRLLLVGPTAEPPEPIDDLEDWIRLPSRQEDTAMRLRTLQRRVDLRNSADLFIDEHGVMHRGNARLVLSPVEVTLTQVLLEKSGDVATREELAEAAWPAGMSSRNLLDVRIARLRRRLEKIDLSLKTVRGRGYLLEMPN